MKVSGTNYAVEYSRPDNRVTFEGTLRLQGKEEYERIYTLLNTAANEASGILELDMRNLRFLNSSGISSLSLFIIQMRKSSRQITIRGNKQISWQAKSLKNFQRLYNKVEIDLR